MSKTYTKQQLSEITDLLGESITIQLRHRFTDGMVTPERKPLCNRFNEISDQLTNLGWDTEDCDLIFRVMIYEIFPVDKYLGCCRDKWWQRVKPSWAKKDICLDLYFFRFIGGERYKKSFYPGITLNPELEKKCMIGGVGKMLGRHLKVA